MIVCPMCKTRVSGPDGPPPPGHSWLGECKCSSVLAVANEKGVAWYFIIDHPESNLVVRPDGSLWAGHLRPYQAVHPDSAEAVVAHALSLARVHEVLDS